MPGGYIICIKILKSVIQKGLELDFLVTENIRIRGSSGTVFLKEILKNPIPVFCGKVDGFEFYAYFVAYGPGISKVCCG